MKQKLLITIACLSIVVQGCYSEIHDRIDECQERLDKISAACEQINSNIKALSTIINALQEEDIITGITYIREGSTIVGYKINFAKSSSVTIYEGKDADVPYVSSMKDIDGKYYWSVKQGKDAPEKFVIDADGNKVLAIGTVPYVVIRDNNWSVTYDNGATWIDLGVANGQDADSMIKNVDVHRDWVGFELSNGAVLIVPTEFAWVAIKNDIKRMSADIEAQCTLIENLNDSISYIKTVKDIESSGEKVGIHIEFANGKGCDIYSILKTNVPYVAAKLDASDSCRYWAMEYGATGYNWILTEEGERVKAQGENVPYPALDIAKGEDGFYRWTISYDGVHSSIVDSLHAIDSAVNTIFNRYDNSSEDYLLLEMKDGTAYKLMKEYAVTMVDTLRLGQSQLVATIPFEVVGDTAHATVVSFVSENKVMASYNGNEIKIRVAEGFSGSTQMMAVFDIMGEGKKNVIKTVAIIK